jgi:hypothetical protein
MITTLAIAVAVVIVGILIFATTKPDTFSVLRSASINAPSEKVFSFINDFNNWSAWSPWEKKDPAMKRIFGTTTSSKGAYYAWEGNKDVGQGSMEIIESIPHSMIVLKLDFIKPFEGHNIVEFKLVAQADMINVTWMMRGPANFMTKLMSVFVSMDSMVGKDFELGLANLKAIAEK